MLRASVSEFGYEIDIAVIADPGIPIGVPGGDVLLRLVDVLHGKSPASLKNVHSEIVERLGTEALVDAAAVFGNFQMMNRVAEGSGIPIPQAAIERERAMITRLGLLDLLKS